MKFLSVVTLAFAPGIFWLWYLYKRDKLEPEPKSLVAKTFFLGMISVIPALILELPIHLVKSPFLLLVIVAPIVEESSKYFFVKKFIYRNTEFDEPIDGIVYAAAAALGFASVENAFYLFSAKLPGQFIHMFTARALLSVPGHALFSSMWGYALGMAKFMEAGKGKALIRRGLILAIVMHGLFNLLACYVIWYGLALLILVGFMWWFLHRRIAKALAKSPHLVKKIKSKIKSE